MTFIKYLFFLILILFVSCDGNKTDNISSLKTGVWRGVISQQGKELPFNFEFVKNEDQYNLIIHNGEESILVDEVDLYGDSILITFNFYDTEIKARIDVDELTGVYNKKYDEGHILPFKAVFNESNRFMNATPQTNTQVVGRYEVEFVEDDGKIYPAVAILEQDSGIIKGTFLTETGDYRFLEGVISGDSLKLSAFDGTHLFLFTALIDGDSLSAGEFWHGKNTYETWKGFKNQNATISDPDKITYLKEGYDNISFSFPDLNGNPVSLSDSRFSNKVVILQIFGSWCPNCMDETKFYSDWYRENMGEEVVIVGLAYENKLDFNYAVQRVNKMKRKLNVPYDFLIAGVSDKEEASKTLPMLNRIISFPTSIFIDKKGEIRRIHTGFAGPGTGQSYEDWKVTFIELMDQLLSE